MSTPAGGAGGGGSPPASASSASEPAAAAPAGAPLMDSMEMHDLQAKALKSIELEVELQPLVGDEEPLSVLIAAYDGNTSFIAKLRDLSHRARGFRTNRGDGNCFYRSFLISLGERFVGKVSLPAAAAAAGGAEPAAAAAPPSPLQLIYERILGFVRGSLAACVAAGFPEYTVVDFQETMIEYLEGLAASGATAETAVYARFRDKMEGAYIIVYLRCLCSVELQSRDEYMAFILGSTYYATVKEFCEKEVNPSDKDADQLQIVAVARAMGVGVRIAYLNASAGDSCPLLPFPEGASEEEAPHLVSLLYRPGHFDVLYLT